MISELWNDCYSAVNGIEVNTVSSIYRLLLSMLLGSVVGYERKRKGQSAGVRTFSLIAMGATLAMLLSIYVPQEYLGLKNGDPGRIAAQVITGIGFLGAGTILVTGRQQVKGLTTAAGLWASACTGLRHLDGGDDRHGRRRRHVLGVGRSHGADTLHPRTA